MSNKEISVYAEALKRQREEEQKSPTSKGTGLRSKKSQEPQPVSAANPQIRPQRKLKAAKKRRNKRAHARTSTRVQPRTHVTRLEEPMICLLTRLSLWKSYSLPLLSEKELALT